MKIIRDRDRFYCGLQTVQIQLDNDESLKADATTLRESLLKLMKDEDWKCGEVLFASGQLMMRQMNMGEK